VPILTGSKLRVSTPISEAAERSFTRTVVKDMVDSLLLVKMVLTSVFSSVLGCNKIRLMMDAPKIIGHKVGSLDLCIVTDSLRSSLF